jgi:hypothetical protein
LTDRARETGGPGGEARVENGVSPAGPTAPAHDVAGTWHGAFWWLGGSYWADEGTCLLEIGDPHSKRATPETV